MVKRKNGMAYYEIPVKLDLSLLDPRKLDPMKGSMVGSNVQMKMVVNYDLSF